jgi:hypothetical protein
MARVEDRSEPHAWLQRHDHDSVHLVIDNVSDLAEIHRIDDLIVPVLLIPVEIFGLAPVPYVMSATLELREVRSRLTRVVEEERVVRPGVLHQPVHRAQDILLRRLANGVLLIVGQDDHVVPLVSIRLVQERGHVLHVVDASPQLAPLSEVVYADQQRLSAAGAVRVLERVLLRSAASE